MNDKILLIVEGMDNIGKDTLINGIKDYYKDLNISEVHFVGPKSKNNQIAYLQQIKQFINNVIDLYKNESNLIIWNRSHIGEYVYGQIYRNLKSDEAKRLIQLIDNELNKIDIHIIYIQLICTSNTLIIDNEDGKSLSNNIDNYKEYLKKIKEERKLFKAVFDIVSDNFNKQLIIVNNGEDFIDKNTILNQVVDQINSIFINYAKDK